eukprot:7146244-Pyramimonas_sp.AAC.1
MNPACSYPRKKGPPLSWSLNNQINAIPRQIPDGVALARVDAVRGRPAPGLHAASPWPSWTRGEI